MTIRNKEKVGKDFDWPEAEGKKTYLFYPFFGFPGAFETIPYEGPTIISEENSLFLLKGPSIENLWLQVI